MAHRVNSQTLFKIPSIHIYYHRYHVYMYIIINIYILKYSMQCVKYLILNILLRASFIQYYFNL